MKHVYAALAFCAACSRTEPPSLPPPTSALPAPPPPSAPEAPIASEDAAPKVVMGPEHFARTWFAESRQSNGNFAIAPSNLRDALTLVALGARGNTAAEFRGVLALPEAPADVVTAAKQEHAAWKKAIGEAQLLTATRLWHDASEKLAPEYLSLAGDALGAAPEAVNFAGKAETARKSINDWAKNNTSGKITELLASGSVDALTRLVATSALYFKASWATPFVAAQTKPAPFNVQGGAAPKQVATMHRRGSLRAHSTSDYAVVDLPYAKSDMSLLIAVSKAPDGSTRALENLYVDRGLAGLEEELQSVSVALALPKFSFRAGGSQVSALKAMGLKEAFSDRANLSGLFASGANQFSVSDVVQRTFVQVDEKGTEAAAASAAVVSVRSMPLGEPLEIKVDRPFLFFLHDGSGHVLFAGRVSDPTQTP